MKRIYRGTEVFLSDAVSIGLIKEKICEAWLRYFPRQYSRLNEPSPQQNGLKIGRANEELIES
ncbi:hypothetical protein OH492_08755 [Vibrio chagasii]|nr:hypothetical protein [Vibrio chagasii]